MFKMHYLLNIYIILFILEVTPERVKVFEMNENILQKQSDHKLRRLGKYSPNTRKNVRLVQYLWPDGVVNYRFSKNYPLEMKQDRIWPAMTEIENVSCIRYKEIKDSELHNVKYVTINEGMGCASSIGYTTAHAMKMRLNATICEKGHILHELLHVLGFWHEHTRTDRGNRIRVLWDNIKTGKFRNFFAKGENEVQNLHLPYDYTSIMHYRANSFALPGKKSIESIFEGAEQLMGQRNMLSMLDVAKINRLYNCIHYYRGTDLYDLPTRK